MPNGYDIAREDPMQNRREPRYVYRIYGLKDRNPANCRKYDANMIHLSDIMGSDTKFGFSFQENQQDEKQATGNGVDKNRKNPLDVIE